MAALLAMALVCLMLSVTGLCAPAPERHYAPADSLTASVITCYPGSDIYALCGHEAIRIRGNEVDSVWNYGLFDFNAPNFIYRFVKGETDYMVAGYPFEWFMPEYVARGSKVIEQDLNLSQEEVERLRKLLQTESLPQNRTYRYNYVKDNCATRILDRLEQAADARIIYPDTLYYGTFRKEMRHFHRDYPWYQFGIDLALGSGIDYRLKSREEMFVPVVMGEKLASTRLADGRMIVARERVLNSGLEDATLGPSPFFTSPLFVFSILLILSILLAVIQLKKKRIFPLFYSIWFGVVATAGCVSLFLLCVSEHEATSPNILTLWLNPLQFVMALAPWWKSWRKIGMTIACIDIVVMICQLIVWPFQTQSLNPAILPVMLTSIVMAASYAIIIGKRGYNNNIGMPTVRSAKRVGRAKARKSSSSRRTVNKNLFS